MNEQANVTEFRRLEAEITESEADVEAKRWRQAELAAEAISDGMSRVEYGRLVGKAGQTIGCFVKIWTRWGASHRGGRPRFADAFATVNAGSDEFVTKADLARREKERQVPSQHEDRVEMATKLLADPKVAKAAVRTVMAAPSHARRVIDSAVHDANAEKRRQERERAAQRASDRALPLPAYMADMVTKMNEWSLGLAALVDDLDELPEGRGRELVAMAAAQLEEQAHRWVEKLSTKADLFVIEGRAASS